MQTITAGNWHESLSRSRRRCLRSKVGRSLSSPIIEWCGTTRLYVGRESRHEQIDRKWWHDFFIDDWTGVRVDHFNCVNVGDGERSKRRNQHIGKERFGEWHHCLDPYPEQTNDEHLMTVQSVEIGTSRQHVHKAMEGSMVASDDATSACITRTRADVERVTRVPRIGIRQRVFTRCRSRDSNDWRVCCWWSDITLSGDGEWRLQVEITNWDSKDFECLPAVSEERRPGALCASVDIKTGRPSTEVGLPYWHSVVLGGSINTEGVRNEQDQVVGHSTSTTDVSQQIQT